MINDGIDEIEFGMKGKPIFVAGLYDDINRIIGILEINVGAGNNEYMMRGDEM